MLQLNIQLSNKKFFEDPADGSLVGFATITKSDDLVVVSTPGRGAIFVPTSDPKYFSREMAKVFAVDEDVFDGIWKRNIRPYRNTVIRYNEAMTQEYYDSVAETLQEISYNEAVRLINAGVC